MGGGVMSGALVIFRLPSSRRRGEALPSLLMIGLVGVAATSSASLLGAWTAATLSGVSIATARFGLLFTLTLAVVVVALIGDALTKPLLKRSTSDRTILDDHGS